MSDVVDLAKALVHTFVGDAPEDDQLVQPIVTLCVEYAQERVADAAIAAAKSDLAAAREREVRLREALIKGQAVDALRAELASVSGWAGEKQVLVAQQAEDHAAISAADEIVAAVAAWANGGKSEAVLDACKRFADGHAATIRRALATLSQDGA